MNTLAIIVELLVGSRTLMAVVAPGFKGMAQPRNGLDAGLTSTGAHCLLGVMIFSASLHSTHSVRCLNQLRVLCLLEV
jgi:hypothetical protein